MKLILGLIIVTSFLDASEIPDDVIFKIQEHVKKNGWSSLYYDVVPNIIRLQSFNNILEVGVALGGHAEAILKNTDVQMYYGVDPYALYDANDGFQSDVLSYSPGSDQKNFDYLFIWVNEIRLSAFKGRYSLIRKNSMNAASLFADESLDCIFIDGDHRYDAVLVDLAAWFPKVRKGGMMLGDDYWMPDVEQAVRNYFNIKNIPISFSSANSGYKIWQVIKD